MHLIGCTGIEYLNGLTTHQSSRAKKIHESLIHFLKKQFNELCPDEQSHIWDGFTTNCETIYIAGFTSSKQPTPKVIGIIQYASSPQGVWINWLGVTPSNPCSFTDAPMAKSFRGMGLGMFLQILVQFQQLSRGWSTRLFLQTLLNSDACEYYLKRGYIRAPKNDITSVPGITENPFVNHHAHVITDELQRKEDTKPEDFLVLYYVGGFVITTYMGEEHAFFFLDKTTVGVIPKDKADVMFKIPFNTDGKEMEKSMNHDGGLRILCHSLFPPVNLD